MAIKRTRTTVNCVEIGEKTGKLLRTARVIFVDQSVLTNVPERTFFMTWIFVFTQKNYDKRREGVFFFYSSPATESGESGWIEPPIDARADAPWPPCRCSTCSCGWQPCGLVPTAIRPSPPSGSTTAKVICYLPVTLSNLAPTMTPGSELLWAFLANPSPRRIMQRLFHSSDRDTANQITSFLQVNINLEIYFNLKQVLMALSKGRPRYFCTHFRMIW